MDWLVGEKAAVSMTTEKLGPAPDALSVAVYIAAITEELAGLAKNHHFDALAYILDMARLEADQISKGWREAEDKAARGSP